MSAAFLARLEEEGEEEEEEERLFDDPRSCSWLGVKRRVKGGGTLARSIPEEVLGYGSHGRVLAKSVGSLNRRVGYSVMRETALG